MKTTKTFEIEIERNNVTPTQFLAYLRKMQKKHPEMACDFDLAWFEGSGWNSDYTDGTPETRPAAAERNTDRPYEKQTYIRWFDGSCYNEIIEWDSWDGVTGHGYYYTVNVEVAEEDREANTNEYLECVARRAAKNIERNAKKAESIREDIRENGEWMTAHYIDMKTAEADRLDRESAELQKIIDECHGTTETAEETTTTAGKVDTDTETETTTDGHEAKHDGTETDRQTDTTRPATVDYTDRNGHQKRRRFETEADALTFCAVLDDRIERGTCGGYILSALSASSAPSVLSAT